MRYELIGVNYFGSGTSFGAQVQVKKVDPENGESLLQATSSSRKSVLQAVVDAIEEAVVYGDSAWVFEKFTVTNKASRGGGNSQTQVVVLGGPSPCRRRYCGESRLSDPAVAVGDAFVAAINKAITVEVAKRDLVVV